MPNAYSVIEQIVEAFAESFSLARGTEVLNFLRQRRRHHAAAPSATSASADGSGTGLMVMPAGASIPEISEALTVDPSSPYSPTSPAKFPMFEKFATNRSFPEIAMALGLDRK